MLITTLDILYICLSAGFLVLVGYVSYMAYQLAKTLQLLQPLLKDAQNVADNVKEITDELKNMKQTVTNSVGIVTTLIQAFISSRDKKKGK